MQWIRLKIYLLPIILQQVDSVTEQYIKLINDVKRNHNNQEKITEFLKLRESYRIEEVDNFYEDNFENPKALIFEKVRIKLKKLLMYDPDHVLKLENDIGSTKNSNFRGLVFGHINETQKPQTNNKKIISDTNPNDVIKNNFFCNNEYQSVNENITSIMNKEKEKENFIKPLQSTPNTNTFSFKDSVMKFKNLNKKINLEMKRFNDREQSKINNNFRQSPEKTKTTRKNSTFKQKEEKHEITNITLENKFNKNIENKKHVSLGIPKTKKLPVDFTNERKDELSISSIKYTPIQKEDIINLNKEEEWKEIHIQIKLSPEEYKLLLEEKANQIKI